MNANPLRLPGQGGTYGVIDLPARDRGPECRRANLRGA